MECKFSYAQGMTFGKQADTNPTEFPLARTGKQQRFHTGEPRFRNSDNRTLAAQVFLLCVIPEMQAHAAGTQYPSMAPLDQYLIANEMSK